MEDGLETDGMGISMRFRDFVQRHCMQLGEGGRGVSEIRGTGSGFALDRQALDHDHTCFVPSVQVRYHILLRLGATTQDTRHGRVRVPESNNADAVAVSNSDDHRSVPFDSP
jgi:hypothetical protein